MNKVFGEIPPEQQDVPPEELEENIPPEELEENIPPEEGEEGEEEK